MSVTVTVFNKGINVSSVTYNNWTLNQSRTIAVKGGEKITVVNTYEEDAETGEDIPTNILYLHPIDADVVIENFSYNPKQINIKIV
jgi:hypothetical protein